MEVIVCSKLVSEKQDIVVTPGCTLNFDNADAKINQFSFDAVKAASRLATDDDEIAALTIGGSLLRNSKMRKGVLSRGPHSLCLAQDAQLGHALPLDTTRALAVAIERIGFDLLIFGEGSGGLYAQQVGLLVGEILQLPVISVVSTTQRQDNTLVIERTLEDNVGVIEFSVPAALYVTPNINMPHILSIKVILGVGKEPVSQWQAGDIDWGQSISLTELVSIRVSPQTECKHIIIDDDPPEAAAELVEHLKKALNQSLRKRDDESIKQRLGL